MFSIVSSAGSFSILTFPVAFVLSILIMISNINLMRKEGRNLKNMLGIVLGILLCIGIWFPELFSNYIYNHTNANVHRETGIGRFMIMFVECGVGTVVGYLECILIGTIAVALKAAKRRP